jgi:hypothetical protein
MFLRLARKKFNSIEMLERTYFYRPRTWNWKLKGGLPWKVEHTPPSCLWQDALEHCARYFFVRVFVVGVAYTDRRTQAFTPLASERHLYARAADQPQTLAYIMN